MENKKTCEDCSYCHETDSPDWRECCCDKKHCIVLKTDRQCTENNQNIDELPLTYEWLEENFNKDEITPPMSVYPQGMYRNSRYYIGVQLMRTCDVDKQISVHNYENNVSAEIRDIEKSQLKSKKTFTIGDLKSLLHLVGLDDLINNVS